MEEKIRYGLLDTLRGAAIVSMAAYHAVWDCVYMFYISLPWFRGTLGRLWQQSICWTFILLSGFCMALGRNTPKRGLTVFLAGALVSVVTMVFMPSQGILFGVLTLIGSCMLIGAAAARPLEKCPPFIGAAVCALLFLLTWGVNDGWIGIGGIELARLPRGLYRGLLASYLGFTAPGFSSADYFSLLPWGFLFFCGYFVSRIWQKAGRMEFFNRRGIPALNFLGRHSLVIYIVHQPLIYGVLWAVFWMMGRI